MSSLRWKMKKSVVAIVAFSFCINGIAFLPAPASAFATCSELKALLRKYRKEGNHAGVEAILGPDGRGMEYTCSGQLARDQKAIRNGTFQAQQDNSAEEALAVIGIIAGIAGSMPSRSVRIPNHGVVYAPAVRNRVPAGARIPQPSVKAMTTQRATSTTPGQPNRPAQTSTRQTKQGSSVGPGNAVGYITQPSGKKDPYYAKQPCATTRQTGATTYECTNK